MSNLLHDDHFIADMNKAKERGEKKEFVNYVSTIISSYFEKEYGINANVTSINLNDKLEKGVASVSIPEISQDSLIPFQLNPEEGFAVEMEIGPVEKKLGVQEYFISIDGEKIAVKALGDIQALKKLESEVRKDYPEIADELQRKYLEATVGDKLTRDQSGMYYDKLTKKAGMERKNVIYSFHDFLMENAPELGREYNTEYWKTAVIKKAGRNYTDMPYDEILEIIATEVEYTENENLEEFFNRFAEEEIEKRAPRTEEEPDISIERDISGKSLDHIPSDIAVDFDMILESSEVSSREELNRVITNGLMEKLGDISPRLYLDNLMVDWIRADKKKRTGDVKILASISDPEKFSVDLGFDVRVEKNGNMDIVGPFDLIKGYYKISEYKIPLNDVEYKVEASSKLDGIKKVLNHMVENDKEDYTFEGMKLISGNVDIIAIKILTGIENDIEITKTYSNVFEGTEEENPWEVKEDKGEKYLKGLYKTREV